MVERTAQHRRGQLSSAYCHCHSVGAVQSVAETPSDHAGLRWRSVPVGLLSHRLLRLLVGRLRGWSAVVLLLLLGLVVRRHGRVVVVGAAAGWRHVRRRWLTCLLPLVLLLLRLRLRHDGRQQSDCEKSTATTTLLPATSTWPTVAAGV